VILNTFLGIFAGIVLVPVGEALNHQFAIFFFRKYLPQVHYLLDVIFLLSFVVAGHVVVNWANVIAYYSYLATGQVYLSIEMVKHWSAGYEDQDDVSLFYSMEYQRVVKERIRSSIIRHIELLRWSCFEPLWNVKIFLKVFAGCFELFLERPGNFYHCWLLEGFLCVSVQSVFSIL
jgi:hypothetical protein